MRNGHLAKASVASLLGLAFLLSGCQPMTTASDVVPVTLAAPESTTLRVAAYNVSLYADSKDAVRQRLAGGKDLAAQRVAAVIQRQRPDLLLLNEFDYDAEGRLADVFANEYLGVGQFGEAAIRYPYRYFAPVNTGEPSGMDLNGDGRIGGPGRLHGEDAFGFGLHPGQYGMVVFSKYPIDTAGVRSFQTLPWAQLPNARRPKNPSTGAWWHNDAVWPRLRLSSKSHWDVPVLTPLGTVHFLVSHPTPPVFDGPENRNGLRNADELTLWRHYLDGGDAPWLCDDQGRCGGLPADAAFVLAGDLNNDPMDGDGERQAVRDLIAHSRMAASEPPESEGAVAAVARYPRQNPPRQGRAAWATGDFGPQRGTLRLDFVLPSRAFQVIDRGVFWPAPGQKGAEWIDASDHHLVWLDLKAAVRQP
jgi:endonuclease/exonuclease/phosphatase family metal-dependent hydrolase